METRSHVEISPKRALNNVRACSDDDHASEYLFRNVGWGAVLSLARSIGIKATSRTRMTREWCFTLAQRLRTAT